jgi:hypothetical protein
MREARERRLVGPLVDDDDSLLVLASGVDPEVEVAWHGADRVLLAVKLGEGGRPVSWGSAQIENSDEHANLLTIETI